MLSPHQTQTSNMQWMWMTNFQANDAMDVDEEFSGYLIFLDFFCFTDFSRLLIYRATRGRIHYSE